MATKLRILLALWILIGQANGAYTEFYVQNTASNLNSGSGTGDAYSLEYASGSWLAGTGVFTVASGDPSLDGAAQGQWASVYANGSTETGFSGRITAVNSTTITVSLSAAHGTPPTDGAGNRTLRIGGAWAGPNGATGFPLGLVKASGTNTAGDPVRVNIKDGIYSQTVSATHGNAGPIFWESYLTTPGDNAGRAIIQGSATGAAYRLLTVSGASNSFEGITWQNNGNSGTVQTLVYITAAGNIFRNCGFKNSWGTGIQNGGLIETVFYEIEATNNRLQGSGTSTVAGVGFNISGSLALRVFAYDNVLDGMSTDGGVLVHRCIIANNGSSGSGSTGDENLFVVCSDYFGNGDHGYSLGDGNLDPMNCLFDSNNFIDNASYGIRFNNQLSPGLFLHNGFGSGSMANGSGNLEYDRAWTSVGTVTYSSGTNPYANAAAYDFDITGSEARSAGYGVFKQIHPSYAGGTVGYPSIGASQQ